MDQDQRALKLDRRTLIATAIAAVVAPSVGAEATPAAVHAHKGFEGWTAPPSDFTAPLDVEIDTGSGKITLGDWLDGRPAVLALWATWCAPCLVEAPDHAAMSRRLEKAGARTQILALQSYDEASLDRARKVLKRMKAEGLKNARASKPAEKAFIQLFGESPVEKGRTSLPALLLLNSTGGVLGATVGLLPGPRGEYDYWRQDATFDLLASL